MKSFTFRRTEADYYMDENNHSVWGFQETTIKADNKAQAWDKVRKIIAKSALTCKEK